MNIVEQDHSIKDKFKTFGKLPLVLAAAVLAGGGLFAAVSSVSSATESAERPLEMQVNSSSSEQNVTEVLEKSDINQNDIAESEMNLIQSETIPETEALPEETETTKADPLNPQFSLPAGFYPDAIQLSLFSETGTEIYYTSDGSTPTTESERYTQPILISSRAGEENKIASRSDTSVNPVVITEPVDKATVIRAIAVSADGTISDIITHTYFVGLNLTRDYHNVNIISVCADESALFDYQTGIYCTGAVYDNQGRYYSGYFIPANYTQTGRNWEREVGVEIFDTIGNSIASQEMGLRIMGGTSRASVQKSLKFYAREEYGQKRLNCALFPDLFKECDPTDDIKKFRTFVLRNGGDDHYGTKFRDAFIQRLIEDRAVSTQHAQPAIGFINGEFSGVYNLQEDYSAYYMQSHFGVPKDDVIMVKTEAIEEGTNEDFEDYLAFSDFVNHADLSDDAVYAEFCEKMDVESLIDYFSFELWIENNDWINNGNNYRLWRSRTITDQPFQDGKWRWAAYDTEYSMGCDRDGEPSGSRQLLSALIEKRYYLGTNFFIQPLMQNKTFRAQFVTTFMDLCNSCFEPEHATAVLDDMYEEEYKSILNKGYRRTGPLWRIDTEENMTAFTENILNDEKKFIQGRTEACIRMLTNCLGLSGETAEITVDVNNAALGSVQIGTVSPDWNASSSWHGIYFTDYPITLTASPTEGHTFEGWSGEGISSTDAKKLSITVPVTQALKITASFQ